MFDVIFDLVVIGLLIQAAIIYALVYFMRRVFRIDESVRLLASIDASLKQLPAVRRYVQEDARERVR